MRFAYSVLLLLSSFVIACGSSPPKETAPLTTAQAIEQGKAPWDKLPKGEQYLYESCDAATKLMLDARTWPMVQMDGFVNPRRLKNGKMIVATRGPSLIAFIQYRQEGAKLVYELGMVTGPGDTQLILLNYNVKRALDTGKIQKTAPSNQVFSFASQRGHDALIVTPFPGEDSTARVPPESSVRSFMLVSPKPR